MDFVFKTFPEWDEQKIYRADNLNVYFETQQQKLVRIDVTKTLEVILKMPG